MTGRSQHLLLISAHQAVCNPCTTWCIHPKRAVLDQLLLEHLLEDSNLISGRRPERKPHNRWKVAMETFNAGFEAVERQDCAETAFLQHLPTALAAEGALDSCTPNQSISLGEQAITIGINKKLDTARLVSRANRGTPSSRF